MQGARDMARAGEPGLAFAAHTAAGGVAVPAWDGEDMADLLALQAMPPASPAPPAASTTVANAAEAAAVVTGASPGPAPSVFRTCCGDANAHGRSYGGQILAQAVMAAARTVPAGAADAPPRAPSMMQFLFLQGTLHAQAVDLVVTPLQDGRRFSSRHVRGVQGAGRVVLDAQVSFAHALPAPAHGAPPAFAATEDPERLPSLADLPAAWGPEVQRAGGYTFQTKPAIDFRLAEARDGLRLDTREPRLRFWLRLRARVGDGVAEQAAAFAYLSDWWINYAALGAHLADLGEGPGLYVASLNHALWWHRPFRADQWLHVEATSPAGAAGRGFSVARVHDRQGRLVASVTQECLMSPRET